MSDPLCYIALCETNDVALNFQIKHFLKLAQQKNWQQDDKVFIAKIDNKVIGFARFVTVTSNHFWLRGLFVLDEYRRQGIAAKLIKFSHQKLAPESSNEVKISCFPLDHLHDFYHRLGYQTTLADNLPETLALRYKQAQKDGKTWLLMQTTL